MGHSRIGSLPATKPWKDVIKLIADGADVPAVATATLRAAERAFAWIQEDAGFREATNLMVEIGLAAGGKDGVKKLAALGITLSENTSVAEVAMTVGAELERRIAAQRERSDIGEIAGKALVSAVIGQLKGKLSTLIEPTPGEVAGVLKKTSQPQGFGEFARTFFSRMTGESLDYFLSKTLTTKLGEGQRFVTNNQVAEFMSAMKTHCEETSVIAQEFAGDWFSKHRFEGGGAISRDEIGGFAWYAMQKMRAEMAARAIDHE
jgi:hypothetical protein